MTRIESLLEELLSLERPLLLALDVDGTIVPIVADPELARIPEETLSTLAALAAAPMVELALITGRDFESLRRMERLEGVWRAVEHGGLVLAPGEAPTERALSPDQRDALDRFEEWVDAHAGDAFIEYKPHAIAVHVRGIEDPHRAERLLREADELAQSLGLHVRRGKALREAEAIRYDKGNALREIFDRSGANAVFFAGDDLTDLSAIEFAALHGIGAFVHSDEQRAAVSSSVVVLESVSEVATLLSLLLQRLAG